MKVALVTGASKGIGKACALRLAKDGYTVVVNYSSSDAAAKETLSQIQAAGSEGMIYKADVSKLDQVNLMIREVIKAYGRIDVLVNNAGIVRDEYLLMISPDTLDKCFELNVKGYIYCAQQVALKMFKQKSGVIINMSSVSSKFALAGQSVYSATKGAVNSLTQTLAKELGAYGIRVNAVAPGFIATEMIEAIPEEKRKAYVEQIRGVDSSYSVGGLLNKHLIEECGRLNVPGRPILYRTTADFLRTFGLESLDELPEIEKMQFGKKELPENETRETTETEEHEHE